MASDLIAMASNLRAMVSNLVAMASNLIATYFSKGDEEDLAGFEQCVVLLLLFVFTKSKK